MSAVIKTEFVSRPLEKQSLDIPVIRLPHARDFPLPRPATPHSAGFDLQAAIDRPYLLAVGNRASIPTGLMMALPPGFEGQIRPRSGLAHRHGVTVLNAPGTIDPDYRGEISVLLINFGSHPFPIERGMRIAQFLVTPILSINWQEKETLEETERGNGGFGSTGV